MPMMSGPKLSERLRATHPRVRTLLITGYADTVATERSGPFAQLPILAKPFRSAEILAKIREVLDEDADA